MPLSVLTGQSLMPGYRPRASSWSAVNYLPCRRRIAAQIRSDASRPESLPQQPTFANRFRSSVAVCAKKTQHRASDRTMVTKCEKQRGLRLHAMPEHARRDRHIMQPKGEKRAEPARDSTNVPARCLRRDGSGYGPPCPPVPETRPSLRETSFKPQTASSRSGPSLQPRIPRKSSSPGPRPSRFPDETACPLRTSRPSCFQWPRRLRPGSER